MSAFLGKIHYWLYNKILWHEKLLEEIIEFAETKNIPVEEIKTKTYDKYGYPDYSPLEAAIDHGNIHGWLQSRIQSIEYRFAAVITELLDNHKVKLEFISEIYQNNGMKALKSSNTKVTSPEDLFTLIFDFMLEGMPCDRVNEAVFNSDEEFTWKTNGSLHKNYWDGVGGEVANYYLLQNAWISGFVYAEGGNYNFIQNADGTKSIRKG